MERQARGPREGLELQVPHDSIGLACGAGRNGSDLQGFKVELFVNGASAQSDTEPETTDLFWSSATGVTTATKPSMRE